MKVKKTSEDIEYYFEDMLRYSDILPPIVKDRILKQKELGATCNLTLFQKEIGYEYIFCGSPQGEEESIVTGLDGFVKFTLLKPNSSFFTRLSQEFNKYEKLYNFQTQSNEFNREEKLRFLDLFRKIMLFNFYTITDNVALIMLYKLGKVCERHTLYNVNDLFVTNQFLGNEPIEHYVERVARRLGIISTSSTDKSVQTESVDLLDIGTQANTDISNLGTQTNVLNHDASTQVEPVVKEEINLMEFEPEENLSFGGEQLMTEEVLERPEPKGKWCKDKIKESCALI